MQILKENIEMLPGENEEWVLTNCSTSVVVANKGLHPTKFTNPLHKAKNIFCLWYLFINHILFLFFPLTLLDVLVFTHVVCRFD